MYTLKYKLELYEKKNYLKNFKYNKNPGNVKAFQKPNGLSFAESTALKKKIHTI